MLICPDAGTHLSITTSLPAQSACQVAASQAALFPMESCSRGAGLLAKPALAPYVV